jgi:proline iminopeptidase
MKKNLLYILLIVSIFSCKEKFPERETVKDMITHIEDSIITEVPKIARLCDSIDIENFRVIIDNNTSLHVEIEGKGNPIVLINGGPGGTHHYFHPWFSRLNQDHQIIYYDQRGTGQSDYNKDNSYSFEQAVDDLEVLRSKLNINTWTVCGYSYGGGLAQFYALKYPEHINGLVLISSLPMFSDENFNNDQEKYLSLPEKMKKEEVIKTYLDGDLEFNSFLYNLSLNGDWKRQNYLKPTANQMIRSALYEWINDKDFNEIMSKGYQNYNFMNAFDNFPIPTLIIEGKEDLTWGSSKAKIFKNNHPNAQFYQIYNSAHTPFKEKPDFFFTILWNFTTSLNDVPKSQILRWKKNQDINYIN